MFVEKSARPITGQRSVPPARKKAVEVGEVFFLRNQAQSPRPTIPPK